METAQDTGKNRRFDKKVLLLKGRKLRRTGNFILISHQVLRTLPGSLSEMMLVTKGPHSLKETL